MNKTIPANPTQPRTAPFAFDGKIQAMNTVKTANRNNHRTIAMIFRMKGVSIRSFYFGVGAIRLLPRVGRQLRLRNADDTASQLGGAPQGLGPVDLLVGLLGIGFLGFSLHGVL